MEQKNNNLIHIFLIIILGLVFLSLMFLSTSKKNIELNYNFKDEVMMTQNDYNVKIGDLIVKNSGFLASKITVDNYKGCIFEKNEVQAQSYDIAYVGSTYSYNEFNGYFPKQYVEVGSNSEENYAITLNGYYSYPMKYDDRGVPIVILNETKIKDLYLFKLESKEENYYDYCMNAKIENAVKKIKLTIKYEK